MKVFYLGKQIKKADDLLTEFAKPAIERAVQEIDSEFFFQEIPFPVRRKRR